MTRSDTTDATYRKDETARQIFSVLGIPPEELAFTMASYSRSRRSFLETNSFITAQKAERFLETFYFAYGHRSIADMAHVPMALENISILAAIEVVAEQLWDGQERSTRYQDFTLTGYCVPDEIKSHGLSDRFARVADGLFAAYERISQAALEYYQKTLTKPDEVDDKQFERTLRARAFDVGRYLLPMATHTSVGQITSARTLEQQISRLLSSPFGEVRRVGEELRRANQEDARDPKAEKALEVLHQVKTGLSKLRSSEIDKEIGDLLSYLEELEKALSPVPAAPTLVKYTDPLKYRLETEAVFRQAYDGLLGRVPVEESDSVVMVEVDDPVLEAVAKLFYTVGYHPFAQIVHHLQRLSPAERRELLEMAFAERGQHDAWLEELRTGYINFDVTMDIGGFRDLHRHRRTQQYRQAYTTRLGYETPDVIKEIDGLETYDEAFRLAFDEFDRVNEVISPNGAYLLPLGTRCRTLFSMDLAEVAYIAELRTRPTGHFSYRKIAYRMYEEVVRRYPEFREHVRVVHPDYEDLTER